MTAPTLKPHLQLALDSITVFTDDGKLDLAELDSLLAQASKDGTIDDEEKRVLGNILARAERDGVAADVQARIDAVRKAHALPTP